MVIGSSDMFLIFTLSSTNLHEASRESENCLLGVTVRMEYFMFSGMSKVMDSCG